MSKDHPSQSSTSTSTSVAHVLNSLSRSNSGITSATTTASKTNKDNHNVNTGINNATHHEQHESNSSSSTVSAPAPVAASVLSSAAEHFYDELTSLNANDILLHRAYNGLPDDLLSNTPLRHASRVRIERERATPTLGPTPSSLLPTSTPLHAYTLLPPPTSTIRRYQHGSSTTSPQIQIQTQAHVQSQPSSHRILSYDRGKASGTNRNNIIPTNASDYRGIQSDESSIPSTSSTYTAVPTRQATVSIGNAQSQRQSSALYSNNHYLLRTDSLFTSMPVPLPPIAELLLPTSSHHYEPTTISTSLVDNAAHTTPSASDDVSSVSPVEQQQISTADSADLGIGELTDNDTELTEFTTDDDTDLDVDMDMNAHLDIDQFVGGRRNRRKQLSPSPTPHYMTLDDLFNDDESDDEEYIPRHFAHNDDDMDDILDMGETIATRTRARKPLTQYTLDELEATLSTVLDNEDSRDATETQSSQVIHTDSNMVDGAAPSSNCDEAAYPSSSPANILDSDAGNADYQRFVELLKSGINGENDHLELNDEEEDALFVPSDEEKEDDVARHASGVSDISDDEEYRNDHTVRVSKRELRDLRRDRVAGHIHLTNANNAPSNVMLTRRQIAEMAKQQQSKSSASTAAHQSATSTSETPLRRSRRQAQRQQQHHQQQQQHHNANDSETNAVTTMPPVFATPNIENVAIDYSQSTTHHHRTLFQSGLYATPSNMLQDNAHSLSPSTSHGTASTLPHSEFNETGLSNLHVDTLHSDISTEIEHPIPLIDAPPQPQFGFTSDQLAELQSQIRDHSQLLVQSYVLANATAKYSKSAQKRSYMGHVVRHVTSMIEEIDVQSKVRETQMTMQLRNSNRNANNYNGNDDENDSVTVQSILRNDIVSTLWPLTRHLYQSATNQLPHHPAQLPSQPMQLAQLPLPLPPMDSVVNANSESNNMITAASSIFNLSSNSPIATTYEVPPHDVDRESMSDTECWMDKNIVNIAHEWHDRNAPIFALNNHLRFAVEKIRPKWLWCPAEDKLLAFGILKFGMGYNDNRATNWSAIKQRYLPAYSELQIQERYKLQADKKKPNPINEVAKDKRRQTGYLTMTPNEVALLRLGLDLYGTSWVRIRINLLPHWSSTGLRVMRDKLFGDNTARIERQRLRRRMKKAGIDISRANRDKIEQFKAYLAQQSSNQQGNSNDQHQHLDVEFEEDELLDDDDSDSDESKQHEHGKEHEKENQNPLHAHNEHGFEVDSVADDISNDESAASNVSEEHEWHANMLLANSLNGMISGNASHSHAFHQRTQSTLLEFNTDNMEVDEMKDNEGEGNENHTESHAAGSEVQNYSEQVFEVDDIADDEDGTVVAAIVSHPNTPTNTSTAIIPTMATVISRSSPTKQRVIDVVSIAKSLNQKGVSPSILQSLTSKLVHIPPTTPPSSSSTTTHNIPSPVSSSTAMSSQLNAANNNHNGSNNDHHNNTSIGTRADARNEDLSALAADVPPLIKLPRHSTHASRRKRVTPSSSTLNSIVRTSTLSEPAAAVFAASLAQPLDSTSFERSTRRRTIDGEAEVASASMSTSTSINDNHILQPTTVTLPSSSSSTEAASAVSTPMPSHSQSNSSSQSNFASSSWHRTRSQGKLTVTQPPNSEFIAPSAELQPSRSLALVSIRRSNRTQK